MKPAKKGAIYLRENAWYKTENVVKMGITTLVKSRGGSYVTSEIERGEFSLIIEIPLNKLKSVDKLLKTHFKEHHVYKGGGTEFYNKCIYELVEPFIISLNIEYKVTKYHMMSLHDSALTTPVLTADLNNNGGVIENNENEMIQLNPLTKNKIYCKVCDYTISCKMDKHLTSKIHNMNLELELEKSKNIILDNCIRCACGNKYKNRSGLWRHHKICKTIANSSNLSVSENEPFYKELTNLVLGAIEDNKKFQLDYLELLK